jgi:glutamate N-acetyltransferase/amino-acid N-acetyltransferase
MEDAWSMVRETDALLPQSDLSSQGQIETLVMSTGVIGQVLPISKIISGIRSQSQKNNSTLGAGFAAWERAAKAFMTTDTFPKLRSKTFTIRGREYRMAGMDKGAGMIHPNMGPSSSSSTSGQLHATLLGCILTDAAVSPRSLQSALTYAVERSFNSISVDGEMSTNDTILALANGAATATGSSVVEIDEEHDGLAYDTFREELTSFAVDLAKLVVRDGEGATKFVTVSVEVSGFFYKYSSLSDTSFAVQGASTYEEAHAVASRISTSALVKTALYGEDAK